MKNLQKKEAYSKLVQKRKEYKFLDSSLTNPSATLFDTTEIEPWAQWQNNLDAQILLIGQEFSDLDTYVNTQGKVERFSDKFEYPSNKNLHEFFQILGHDIGHPTTPNYDAPIFFTNAVMGLKTPPMSANFKTSWLIESREHFLKPLIEIINPQIIITVGKMATASVLSIYSLKTSTLLDAVNKSPIEVDDKKIFPVYHTGGLGIRNRPKEQQINDWKRIKSCL